MGDVIDFDAPRVRKYVVEAIEGFLNDPPDSDFQEGYMAAVCAVYREALGGKADARLQVCERMLEKSGAES